MRTVFTTVIILLAGLVSASPAPGQPPGRVHRMEINSGPRTTVRYFPQGLSPSMTASLHDLARAENENAYLNELQELKRQYISDERLLESKRQVVQQELYGAVVGNPYGLGLYGGAYGYGLAYGYGYGLPYASGPAYAFNFNPALSYGAPVSTGLSGQALGFPGYGYGGDDSVIKTAMASVMREQSRPDYAATVSRDLEQAVARTISNPSVRMALGMSDSGKGRDRIRPIGGGTDPVVVVLKDGERIGATKIEETKDWVILHTAEGKVRVRPTEVNRVYEGTGAGGTRPASD